MPASSRRLAALTFSLLLSVTALAISSRRRNIDQPEGGARFDGRLVAVCASGLLVLGVGALALVLMKGL